MPGTHVSGELAVLPDHAVRACTALRWDARLTTVALDVLNREMFAEAEAARLIREPRGTMHYRLEGGERRGKTYQPIMRIEATGRAR